MKTMENQIFTKKDWLLFREKIVGWQENYINQLNNEYIALLSGNADPSTKFWKLYERILNDQKKAGVQLHMSRSEFIYNLVELITEQVITFDDLEDFSDSLKETVQRFLDLRRQR